MVIEMSSLRNAIPKHPANHLPRVQKANIELHPSMTHAQVVHWKQTNLKDGQVLVHRPEPKEVA
jgi:hypothetical protein